MTRVFKLALFFFAFAFMLCIGESDSYAISSDPPIDSKTVDSKTGGSKKQPVLLTAKQVSYDSKTSIATASGNVEVVQGDTIVMADFVTYNQTTDVVHAVGHVSMLQPSGDIVFANDAKLKHSLEKGIIDQFRARLKDNSLFAAREAKKLSKNITKLKDAVYSPCNVCAPKPGEEGTAPLWQMKASDVTVNENTQKVQYHNAFMEVYGVPVLYTPYFSHPTPDAPSQSGLLMPQYYHSTNLGNVAKEPVYLSLAPNTDVTLTPWYMSDEKPLLQGELRHLFDGGFYTIRGAFTDTYNRDENGNLIAGSEQRGYIDVHGRAALSEYWSAGIDAERTTDNTFLSLYGLGWQDMLSSRIYAERIEDRNYAVIESLAFQGLQQQDVSSQSPYILPQASVHIESDPMVAHSRFSFDGNALELEREQGDSDSRLSSTVAWKLPYVTRDGQVIEAKALLRADAYSVSDQTVNSTTGETFSGDTGRVMPELDLDWRYPFINHFGEGKSLTIAPIVELAASPNMRNSSNIPNEDSQIAELSDINLFSPDRFAGLDQIESGFRGTYGTRGQLQFADKEYFEWLLGQAYQDNSQSPFPITTTTDTSYSDYIGRLAMRYNWLDMSYRFRLDRQTLAPTSNEVTTGITLSPVTMEVTYISLKDEPIFGDRKEVFGNANIDLTKNWIWSLSGRKDLGSDVATSSTTATSQDPLNLLNNSNGTVGLGTGLIFHNECVMITSNLTRSYISVQDVKPSTTISVNLVLKNFGNPSSNTGSPTLPGSEKIVTTSDHQVIDNPSPTTNANPVLNTEPTLNESKN